MAKIYVATSWRNEDQQKVVQAFEDLGHRVYDFKHPCRFYGNVPYSEDPYWNETVEALIWENGFRWDHVKLKKPYSGTPEEAEIILRDPASEKGFDFDMNALNECDALVLVLPCGRSAHLEAGYATGLGKPVYVLQYETPVKLELMYKMFESRTMTTEQISERLNDLFPPADPEGALEKFKSIKSRVNALTHILQHLDDEEPMGVEILADTYVGTVSDEHWVCEPIEIAWIVWAQLSQLIGIFEDGDSDIRQMITELFQDALDKIIDAMPEELKDYFSHLRKSGFGG